MSQNEQLQRLEQEQKEVIVELYHTQKALRSTQENTNNIVVNVARAAGYTEEELDEGVDINEIIARIQSKFAVAEDSDTETADETAE